MNDDELKKAVEDLKKYTPDYNPSLKTATRAEFVTNVRKFKKPGCRLWIMTGLLSIFGVGYGIYFAYTHILLAYVDGIMWLINHTS